MTTTTPFFQKLTDVCHSILLKSEPRTLKYLKDRGLTDQTIKDYNLGAFPEDVRSLYAKHQLDPVELREHNIIWNAEQSQFRNYPIVIPIHNTTGTPIAIGCRTLLGDVERKKIGIPKYINSTYKKTSYLFGLNKAHSHIRLADKVYVVEGYFDAITAHQNRIMNVVATCGTMFTEKQLIVLSRYTNNVCLFFDNDTAGKRSAKSVMNKLKEFDVNINLSCRFTPDGYKDLDEYLVKGGSTELFKD
jgi:DNA primase